MVRLTSRPNDLSSCEGEILDNHGMLLIRSFNFMFVYFFAFLAGSIFRKQSLTVTASQLNLTKTSFISAHVEYNVDYWGAGDQLQI